MREPPEVSRPGTIPHQVSDPNPPAQPEDWRFAPQVPGPYGRSLPADYQPEGVLALPPSCRPIGRRELVSSNTGVTRRWNRVQVERPTILSARFEASVASVTGTRLSFHANPLQPSDRDGANGFSYGIGGCHAGILLPNPGIWYVIANTNSDGEPVLVDMLDGTNPEFVRAFTAYDYGAQTSSGSPSVLPAATDDRIATLGNVVVSRGIEVSNVGANPCAVNWGGVLGSQQDGILLEANGGRIRFEGDTLACAELWGYSTAGTTVMVVRYEV